MELQDDVAEFVREHDMQAPPAYRLLDLVAEVGEVASEVNQSSGYGDDPVDITVSSDELGDVLFALLALADGLGIDSEVALQTAMEKYEGRIDGRGTAASDGHDQSEE